MVASLEVSVLDGDSTRPVLGRWFSGPHCQGAKCGAGDKSQQRRHPWCVSLRVESHPPSEMSTKCGGHIHPFGKQRDRGLLHRTPASLPPKGKGHS